MLSFPRPEMIEVGDVELEVFQAGQGGIPVVLAHGWPEHAFSWRHQVPALVDEGYHVIVRNQRGYGRSSQPEPVEAYDCHHMPADLTARLVGGVAKEKLSQTGDDPQLDLLVSHDFTLYTVKDQLLKQGTHRYPDVHYLDGIAFFNRDGKTFIQSHHEPAIELDVSLPV